MSTRLALRIQERFEALSPSERRLAELVLERQDDLLTYSATELASFAGVSKTTAARLFRSLGYRDFNEVRLQAREERNLTAPFERRPAAIDPPVGARSISAHLATEIAALTRSFESLRSDDLARGGEFIASARRVWVLGFGAEEGLARLARTRLARLRADVHLLGSSSGALAEDLALTGPDDVLLLVQVSPRPLVLRSILAYCRTTRMTIIAVVDRASTAWARRFARIVITCHDTPDAFGGSLAVTTSALHLLSVAAAERIGRAARLRADLIAEIHEELGDIEGAGS